MPYIDKSKRADYDHYIDRLLTFLAHSDGSQAGDLNYIITRIITGACSPNARWKYEQLNEAIGVLQCAQFELYRRIGGPKEDLAIKENGDTKEYDAWMQNRFPGDYQ